MEMKTLFFTVSLMGLGISSLHAEENFSGLLSQSFSIVKKYNEKTESSPVELKVKKNNLGVKYPKSPILIPEVTIDGHTLHFITPCTGLTLQLVQDDEVCYETVISSDYLEIPSDITGMYELQILRGNYVFFAEIEL